jgi:hypothetical protein
MALLVYFNQDKVHEFDVPNEKGMPIYLQLNDDHSWTLDLDENVQRYEAQLVRADSGFYAVIAYRKLDVRVNGIKVFGLRTLRNADEIRIGEGELRFYEWLYRVLTIESSYVGMECPFCRVPFAAGDRIILCPRCDTPLHDYCWASRKGPAEGCVLPNCGYIVPEEEPYVTSQDKADA